jgi:MFS family permease
LFNFRSGNFDLGSWGLDRVLRALRHRNLKLYLSGQLVSLLGTWMQQLAVGWLIYRYTHSPFWLGVSYFSSQIASFALGPFAGVWIDRSNLHRLLKWTQGLSALQALALGLLTWGDRLDLTGIILLNLSLGVINAVDMPTRQAFVIQMVGKKADLANAIAMNSSVINGTRLIGPIIAGAVISAYGESICFLLNALSFGAVFTALHWMKLEYPRNTTHREPAWHSLQSGFRFAFGFRPIGTLLIHLSILSVVGAPYNNLLPVLSDQLFKGGVHTLSLFTSVSGLGAFAAALYLLLRKSVLGLGRFIAVCGFFFALGLIALPFAVHLWIMLPLLFFLGFALMIQMAGSNILIQTLVEDDKRGRVMSLFSFAVMGLSPFGSLWMGSFAERWGLTATLVFSGGVFLFASFWLLCRLSKLSHTVRPIYLRMKILTETSSVLSLPEKARGRLLAKFQEWVF